MTYRSVLAVLICVIAVAALGCGGKPDYLKNAKVAAPVDIGAPSKFPLGATLLPDGNYWVVKAEEDGETRLWVLGNRMPIPGGGEVQFDPEKKIFYSRGRKYRYDIHGNSLRTVPKGPNKGKPGLPLKLRVVEIDPATGDVMLSKFKKVPEESRNDPSAGAYVVVP